MAKRLTVHLAGVPRTTKKVEYKDDNGKFATKDKHILVNTISYILDKNSDVEKIVRAEKYEVKKYYISNIS